MTDVAKSQPEKKKLNLSQIERGQANRLYSKVADLVRWLKENPAVHRLEDLAIKSGNDDLLTNPEMLSIFRSHDRVAFDEKTGLYRYRPDFDIQNRDDLLSVLQKYLPRGGIPMKTLRESYPNAQNAIEDLEKEGKVLVLRSAGKGEEKEGVMKTAFYDEIGKPSAVDKEFKDLWHSLKTPDEVDLPREMKAEGLKPTATAAVENENTSANLSNKKKRKSANRRIKITNTHIKEVDLTRDYVPKKP